jgi:WD40 repeat protein
MLMNGSDADLATLWVWDSQAHQITHQVIGSNTASIGWASDSSHVVAKTEGNRQIFWNLETAQAMSALDAEVLHPQIGTVTPDSDPVLSPDGSLGIRWYGGKLVIYDTMTDYMFQILPIQEHVSSVDIEWSPDGRLVAIGSQGYQYSILVRFQVVDTTTWEITNSWDSLAFAFSPDGQWMAVESGGAVVVWPVPRGETR